MQSSLTSPVMPHHPHHPHHPQHAQAALAHHPHSHPHAILQPYQQGQPSASPDPSHQQGPYMDPGMPGSSMTANTVRKKGGRGPGKRENRDKPVVSVRWEEADLTDRLISALELNERWAAVFAQAGPDQARAVIGVPKRDLQREIARYLFQNDTRYELDDKKAVEALAVSVKNKLFKIQNLFAECRHELGPYVGNLKDENEIPPDSEHAMTWARVKDKFPQFFRVRDLVARSPLPLSASASSRHDETSPSLGETSGGGGGRPRTGSLSSAPIITNGGSGAAGPSNPRPLTLATGATLIQGHPGHLDAAQTASPYDLQAQQFRYQPPLVPPPRVPPPHFPTYSPPTQHPELQHPTPQQPQPPVGIIERYSPAPQFRSFTLSPSPPPPASSPPLLQTITAFITQLESRKRQRDEQYISLKRAKIEERERVRERQDKERQRWHEREMIRLKTRLALVERGEPVPDGDDPRDPGEGLGVIGSGVGGLGVGVRNEVSGMGLVPGTGHSHGSGTVSVNDPSVHSTAGNGTSQHR